MFPLSKGLLSDLLASSLVTSVLFIASSASLTFAALSCSVTTTCNGPSVVAFRMSSTTNAHAEVPANSNYTNLVCCTAAGASLSNSCSGNQVTLLKLASTTNAHVEENSGSTFTNNVCLSVGSGFAVSAAYQASNCSGFDTTVASIVAAGNSHVGTSTAYTTKVCASVVASSLTFLTDAGSQTFPAQTPGTLVATTTILTATTNNSTGFNVVIQRANSTGTMSLGGGGVTFIPDKSPDWIPGANTSTVGNATASTTQPNTLQFRIRNTGTDAANYASAWWGSNDTTANALFGGISSTTQLILNRTTSALSTTTAYVLYDLNTPATQKTGSYSGSLTYTATANP